MKTFYELTRRNIKLFFKDKGMFFTSLITPAILLVLYVTFLGNVYRDSLCSSLPEGLSISNSLIDGLVCGELVSSLLAVSCVTVAFCSNFLMVQDKANGVINDLLVSPVRPSTLSLSYYFANLMTTLAVCFVATAICLVYTAFVGWYMTPGDMFLLLLDVVIIVLFGSALSSVVNFFLSTQGQISAVGTVISSGYGFICGAYMPLSSFSEGLRHVVSFLPGTYGTSLVRLHAMRGAIGEMEKEGLPSEVASGIMRSLDCNVSFFDHLVSESGAYIIICASTLLLLGVYILLNISASRKKSPRARGLKR